jgi:FAD/FMN-containing dehydrogenase
MPIKRDLADIIKPGNVLDDEQTLAQYAADQSFVSPRRPDVVVFAESAAEVQAIVRYANATRVPIVPFSSGLNLHGAAIPKEGGIVLNLSRMNAILEVNTDNWHCVIEPGVTAAQLQDALAKHQLRAMLPFGIHPNRSVLSSYLERDPAAAAASFEYGNELIMDTELVLPTGELFRTGLWSAGVKPGSPMGPVRAMLNRLWTGAQGTLGIMTKMNIKVEYLPEKRKVFLIQFDSFPEAMEPLRMIQRKEIGVECLLLNKFNLAALLCKDWSVPGAFPAAMVPSDHFEQLREKLPEWVMAVCLNGGPRMPEGKIAYEEEALQEICSTGHLQIHDNMQMEQAFLAEMLRPWGILKKFCYRGSVHDVVFKTTLRRFPEFQRAVMELINTYNYPLQDVGICIMPLERGRAFHCSADFHCNPTRPQEVETVKNLWYAVSERLIDEGAFFDRPYGAWAEMVYSRAGTYTQKLKDIKRALDPNNICNPGHLCF